MSETYIVIDLATTNCFVGLSLQNNIKFVSKKTNNIADSFFESLNELQRINNFSSQDISKIIFNAGPGSTLGIRTCLMFIKTLLAINKDIKTYSYSTFDVAFSSKDSLQNVVLSYSNGKYLHKIRNSDIINVLSKDEAERLDDCIFINTKHIYDDINITYLDYNLTNYVIDFIKIANETNYPQQISIQSPSNDFKKWTPNINLK